MSEFFDLYFYWLGVATAVVFAFIGYCVTAGVVVSWAWNHVQDARSLLRQGWCLRHAPAGGIHQPESASGQGARRRHRQAAPLNPLIDIEGST